MAGIGDYLILPVHDEAIADVPADIAEEVSIEMARVMSDPTSFVVPITADREVTDRWGTKYLKENEDPWVSPDLVEAGAMDGDL